MVASVNYGVNGIAEKPKVAQVLDVTTDGFVVKVEGALPGTAFDVHWMAVEEGVYNMEDHGIKMEAFKFNSTVTDHNGSYLGQQVDYVNSYTNPVVVGQVMTYNNDNLYSVFWARGETPDSPPDSSHLYIGKHKSGAPEAEWPPGP